MTEIDNQEKGLLGISAALFLSIYNILSHHPVITDYTYISDFIFIFLSIIILVQRKTIYIYKPMLYFFIFVCFQSLLLAFFERNYLTSRGVLIRLTLMFLFFYITFMFTKQINRKYFSFFYYALCILSMVVMFVQGFYVYILNIGVFPLIPFFDRASKDIDMINIYRPTAFFFEPQHYASILLPFLIICLYKKRLTLSLLITLSILISTSTQGIVICSVFWIIHIFEVKIKSIYKWLSLVAIILLVLFFLNSDFFTFSQNKILNVNISDDIRVTRAWGVFYDMPLEHKFTGIGMGVVNDYITITGNANKWLLGQNIIARTFLSSLGGNFVHFGIVGGLLYIYLILKAFIGTKNNNIGRKLVILIFLSSFSQLIVFNNWFVFYWLFLFSLYFDIHQNKHDFLVLKTF